MSTQTHRTLTAHLAGADIRLGVFQGREHLVAPVVLMVGGNIPGVTKVLSIAIYDHVEVLEYSQAHFLSAFLLIFSFVILTIVYTVNRRLPIHVS